MFRLAQPAEGKENEMSFIYRVIMRWATRRTVVGRKRDQSEPSRGRFSRREVDRFIDAAWRRYEALATSLPTQPTTGSRITVSFAALTLSFFRVLLDAGIERKYAIELVADTNWRLVSQWGRFGRLLARVLPKVLIKPIRTDLARRVQEDGGVALSFPFNPPGYLARYVPMKDAQAFDVIRCPVAEAFRAQGEADLCRASMCDLDYTLAEMQGLRLQRAATLVEGSDHCDFHFFFASQGKSKELSGKDDDRGKGK